MFHSFLQFTRRNIRHSSLRKITLLISFQMDWNGLYVYPQLKYKILKLYSNPLSRFRGSEFEFLLSLQLDWIITVRRSCVFQPESKNPTTGNRWNNLIASPIIGTPRTPSPPNKALVLLSVLWNTGKPKHAIFCWKQKQICIIHPIFFLFSLGKITKQIITKKIPIRCCVENIMIWFSMLEQFGGK